MRFAMLVLVATSGSAAAEPVCLPSAYFENHEPLPAGWVNDRSIGAMLVIGYDGNAAIAVTGAAAAAAAVGFVLGANRN